MRFFDLKGGSAVPYIPVPTLLCVGNFDGVHLGHRQLIERARSCLDALTLGGEEKLAFGVWFFDSSSYKGQDQLCTLEEKLTIFASLGFEYAAVAEFNEMRYLSPVEFVSEILIGNCRCRHAVCGENFRFGRGAAGDAAELCRLMGGNATVVPLLSLGGDIVSSSRIRLLLSCGEIDAANALLGGHYSICEIVVHGKELGRTLGVPTINQYPTRKPLLLSNGVYATLCTLDGVRYLGVTNVGIRPTTDTNGVKNAETYLLDYTGECYGRLVNVEFIARLRDEMHFSDLSELSAQVGTDIENARALLKNKG